MFYWPFQGGTSFVGLLCFCSVLCLLCLCARLFICALWSPAGKRLTSLLAFVVSAVNLSLSHWYPGSGVILDCIDSWCLHPCLLCLSSWILVIVICSSSSRCCLLAFCMWFWYFLVIPTCFLYGYFLTGTTHAGMWMWRSCLLVKAIWSALPVVRTFTGYDYTSAFCGGRGW